MDVQSLPRPADAKPPLMLLVVGETARADHFSLNGYARNTNPETTARGVISFTQVSACGTSTAASLPCMFLHLGREAFQAREHEHENLLDLLQQAGLAVLWLDNQAGCKGLCERVPHEALLVGLGQRLAALPAERRARGLVLVLHQMGSHGPAYHRRSPAERKPFLPECTTHALQDCRRDALINAYDNSIAYTDHVLGQAIGWLDAQRDSFAPMLIWLPSSTRCSACSGWKPASTVLRSI
jgi:lipid A ethanolaminephosphotransferase